MIDTTPHLIASLLALGMALAFVVADRHSPTSRALSLSLAGVGLSILCNVHVMLTHFMQGDASSPVPVWSGLLAIPEVVAFVAGFEWILRIRRTLPTRELRTVFGDNLLRVAQGLAILYGLLSIAMPQARAHEFLGALMESDTGLPPGFYLFAAPLELSMLLATGSALLLLNRRPDAPEKLRLIAFLIGAPFMASGLILPLDIAPVSTAVGLLILLIGAVQYHVIQGQRAQFLSRFLAPQVAELVRERGLKHATEEQTLELSVVSCDLRGFTAFSRATESSKVIAILREYYDAVGEAATAFGGTIKDQAGDGVLILVGAPIALADHARRALELAQQIRRRGMAVTERWSDQHLQLGVGVGVASGFVTVGVIGAASRLEYTAVGPPVNLASRLCSEARHGEILIDERSAELVGDQASGYRLAPGQPLTLKGYTQPVPHFVMGQPAALA
ncbi:MAG: adenylate/guanylate cyclase domain-containing protein [Nevskiales bacterium]